MHGLALASAPAATAAAPGTGQAFAATVVSMPFFTPFASCYPGLLITGGLGKLGGRARFVPANAEFYARCRTAGLSDRDYKAFTNRHLAGDVALLPLWLRDPTPDQHAELNRLRRVEALPDGTTVARAFDSYVDTLAQRLVDEEVVLLTATHFQFLPSLLLARRLAETARRTGRRRPRIVLGGYFGSAHTARAVLNTHEELDVLVYGEAEDGLARALDLALSGQRELVYGGARGFRLNYTQQESFVAAARQRPWLRDRLTVSLELSRGCYWDQCDFCNFNDSYDARFKMHDPAQVLTEMDQLADRFGQRRFQFLDTALPPRFVNLLEGTRDFQVFCEIRPDFGIDRLEALTRLGQVSVQIGLETLDDAHLAVMNKRQTVQDGVEMLWKAKALGILPVWGVMLGHPKETDRHRADLLAEIRRQRAAGLPAPKYLTECELRPGSPLWTDRAALGLTVEFPWRVFDTVLPPEEHNCALIPCRVRGMPEESPGYPEIRGRIVEELLAWQREQNQPVGLDDE